MVRIPTPPDPFKNDSWIRLIRLSLSLDLIQLIKKAAHLLQCAAQTKGMGEISHWFNKGVCFSDKNFMFKIYHGLSR